MIFFQLIPDWLWTTDRPTQKSVNQNVFMASTTAGYWLSSRTNSFLKNWAFSIIWTLMFILSSRTWRFWNLVMKAECSSANILKTWYGTCLSLQRVLKRECYRVPFQNMRFWRIWTHFHAKFLWFPWIFVLGSGAGTAWEAASCGGCCRTRCRVGRHDCVFCGGCKKCTSIALLHLGLGVSGFKYLVISFCGQSTSWRAAVYTSVYSKDWTS